MDQSWEVQDKSKSLQMVMLTKPSELPHKSPERMLMDNLMILMYTDIHKPILTSKMESKNKIKEIKMISLKHKNIQIAGLGSSGIYI